MYCYCMKPPFNRVNIRPSDVPYWCYVMNQVSIGLLRRLLKLAICHSVVAPPVILFNPQSLLRQKQLRLPNLMLSYYTPMAITQS